MNLTSFIKKLITLWIANLAKDQMGQKLVISQTTSIQSAKHITQNSTNHSFNCCEML